MNSITYLKMLNMYIIHTSGVNILVRNGNFKYFTNFTGVKHIQVFRNNEIIRVHVAMNVDV